MTPALRLPFIAGAVLLLISGCAVKHGADGGKESYFEPRELAKGDIDRVVEVHQLEVMASLHRLAEKLYRRNPREWKRGGQVSAEAAVARIFAQPAAAWPELEGKREGAAIQLAFREDFSGDRVAALMIGLLSMVDAAFEGKREFFMLDELNAQKLYNCARNFEVAVWKLSSTQVPAPQVQSGGGSPMLLSNEIDGASRNLSFEREFGRIIGNLDVLSRIIAGKNERAVNRIVQNIATAVFLPVKELSFFK
jgi:hypothetical protein